MKKYRSVQTYKHYFEEFFQKLDKKVQKKFIWTFELIEDLERVPETYFKHLQDGIYEIRVKFGSNIYRVFAFFDADKLVIAINGFQKKSQKTPKEELKRAKAIRKEYEQEKQQS